jgi:hypothetical protein
MTEVWVSRGAAGTLPSCYMESLTLQEFSSTITQLTGEYRPTRAPNHLLNCVNQMIQVCMEYTTSPQALQWANASLTVPPEQLLVWQYIKPP